jgi:hypothetical protein
VAERSAARCDDTSGRRGASRGSWRIAAAKPSGKPRFGSVLALTSHDALWLRVEDGRASAGVRIRGAGELDAHTEPDTEPTTEPGTEPGSPVERCPICLEPAAEASMTTRLACGHRGCTPCLRSFVSARVRDGEVLERQLRCPFSADCRRELDLDVLRVVATPALFSRLLQLRAVRWQPHPSSGMFIVYCGTPRCPPFLAPVPSSREPVDCPVCARRYCSSCQGDWHESSTCHQGREAWVQTFAKKQGWVGCPICGVIVEKRGGCNFITCTSARCNGLVNFCYLCGEEVDAKAHNSQEHFLDGPFGSKCVGLRDRTSRRKYRRSFAQLARTRVCTIL